MTLRLAITQRLGAFDLEADITCGKGVTILFGTSGSGKSSLMRLMAGLARPDSGRISFGDEILSDPEKGIFKPAWQRRFGVVFQDPRLFPHLDVRQNLLYGARQGSGSATLSLEAVTAILGISTLLDRRPATLSGGEKHRVAIGRALLSSPRLLLMDEPLAALDEARKAEILPMLESLRDEFRLPIIYVSHSIAEVARLADEIVVLNEGKVEASGPATEIFGQKAFARATGTNGAGTLIEGQVTGHDARHNVSQISTTVGQLQIPGPPMSLGKKVRIHLPARDVMIATSAPQGLSAMNSLAGEISALETDSDSMVLVTLTCHGQKLLARITSLSAELLGLKPGQPVHAIIKSAALERG